MESSNASQPLKYMIYRDAYGLYRWRMYGPNGQPIAAGVAGHNEKLSCFEEVGIIRADCGRAPVEDATDGPVNRKLPPDGPMSL